MFLVTSQPGLSQLLSVPQLLAQVWPSVVADLVMVIQILGTATSLAQALTLQVFVLLTPTGVPAQIGIAIGSLVITGLALHVDHSHVEEPHSNLDSVVGLHVLDVAVGGVSAIRAAV